MPLTRLSICTAGLLLALLPAVTLAVSAQQLAAKRQANANDAARCILAAQGVQLPGRIAPSTPEAAAAAWRRPLERFIGLDEQAVSFFVLGIDRDELCQRLNHAGRTAGGERVPGHGNGRLAKEAPEPLLLHV